MSGDTFMTFPESLIRGISQGRIVPFVGSGASMAVKKGLFPSWGQLLGKLADKLDAESKPIHAQIVRQFVEIGELNKAADLAIDSLEKAHFRDAMKSIFDINQPVDVDFSLHDALWSLNPRVIVTTNYDRVLEWAKPSQTVKNTEVSNLADLFSGSTPQDPAVWHLHGHISDSDSLILSPKQYNALYRDAKDDKHSLAAAWLQLRSLFANHPLLFVGFGMQDEYVMAALSTVLEIFGGNLKPSYALLKKGDDRAAELWKKYQITVIEFKDYGQPLVELVKQMAHYATTWSADAGGMDHSPPPIPSTYITWLTDQCADITPLGMAPAEGRSVCLQQVYVPLVTTQRIDAETNFAPDDAGMAIGGMKQTRRGKKTGTKGLDSMARGVPTSESQVQLLMHRLGEQSLYVSGDPGTGKSTFCRWIAWLAATGEIPDFEVTAPEGFSETLPDSLRGRLPVLVPLREFREYLPEKPGRRTLTAAELESALERWLDKTRPGNLHWSDVGPHLKAGSLLIILDGADELPLSDGEPTKTWSPRECLLNGLMSAAVQWMKPGNRLLVTSRPYGLDQDQVRNLERVGLAEARLDALSAELQDLLAKRWFVALPKFSPDGRSVAETMLRKVRQLSDNVADLAGNPLLLTAICIIYGEGRELPKDIHELYHRIINTSLHSRYSRDTRSVELVRARLAAIAFGMNTGEPHDPTRTSPKAEVSYGELDHILADYIGANPETESGFRGQIDAREELLNHSGLLTQKASERASFYHLSFQEFLAAERLTRRKDGESTEKLFTVVRQHSSSPNWRPTLRFLFARRVKDPGWWAGIEMLDQILNTIDLNSIDATIGLALCAVDALKALLDVKLELQEPLLDRCRTLCLAAIEQAVPLESRVELARMLGLIGDPRVVQDLIDPSAWVTVDPRKYFFGDDKQPYDIPQAFQLSTFPVTNAQFAPFVEDGYKNEALWDPFGWAWRTENGISEPRYWQDVKWNGPTQPVVGVSWWEANAFCRWANVRLPSELEWEAAARGPGGLVYPWGNDWHKDICNSSESGLGVTTPVGIFPGSVASCGAHDMAGNVWEWCSDHDDPAKAKDESAGRVLRGGSWNNRADDCRSAIRNLRRPGSRYDSVGFRVARTL